MRRSGDIGMFTDLTCGRCVVWRSASRCMFALLTEVVMLTRRSRASRASAERIMGSAMIAVAAVIMSYALYVVATDLWLWILNQVR